MSDTPIQRKIVKLGFQVFRGKSQRHHFMTWPNLNISDPLQPKWKNKRIQAQFVARLPPNLSQITIIGSGPSLSNQNISVLAEHSSIFLNGAISLANRVDAPLAIACEDERFVWRHRKLFHDAPRSCIWMLSPPVMRNLLSDDETILNGLTVLPLFDILKPPHSPRWTIDDNNLQPFLDRNATAALSLSPEIGTIPVGTVAYSVLQHALAALPQTIGLAGIDLSNAHMPRFNETSDNSAFSGIIMALDQILEHFILAKKVAVERGISIGHLDF